MSVKVSRKGFWFGVQGGNWDELSFWARELLEELAMPWQTDGQEYAAPALRRAQPHEALWCPRVWQPEICRLLRVPWMVPAILRESRDLENLLERVRDPQMGARHFLKWRRLNSNLDLLGTHRIISVISHLAVILSQRYFSGSKASQDYLKEVRIQPSWSSKSTSASQLPASRAKPRAGGQALMTNSLSCSNTYNGEQRITRVYFIVCIASIFI